MLYVTISIFNQVVHQKVSAQNLCATLSGKIKLTRVPNTAHYMPIDKL